MPSAVMQWQTLSLLYPQIQGCNIALKGYAEHVCIKKQHLLALQVVKMVVAAVVLLVDA